MDVGGERADAQRPGRHLVAVAHLVLEGAQQWVRDADGIAEVVGEATPRLAAIGGGDEHRAQEQREAVGVLAQRQQGLDGSAGGDDFAYYRLAYFPGLLPEEMVVLVERGETAVANGELGVWDTTLLDDSLYTLLLTVVRADGTFDEVAIPVTVEN